MDILIKAKSLDNPNTCYVFSHSINHFEENGDSTILVSGTDRFEVDAKTTNLIKQIYRETKTEFKIITDKGVSGDDPNFVLISELI